MHSHFERVLRRLSPTERMTAIVGTLVMAAMLSAIALDRWLERPAAPVVITMAPQSNSGAYSAVEYKP